MKKLMTILAAGLVMVAVLTNPVKADDDDNPKPPSKSPSKPAPKAVAPALTDESLGMLLEQLGYEPKATKSESHGTYYTIELAQEGWTFRYTVSLSPSKKFLWITTNVFTLSEGQKPSADFLLKLLEENDRIGPVAISYDKQYRQVRVALALFNRGITPAILREQLSFFTTNVVNVGKICDAALKPPVTKKPPVDDDDK